MPEKTSFFSRSHFLVQISSDWGTPFALRVQTRRLLQLGLALFFILVLTVTGTLLFFRELEVSRKLQERLLTFDAASLFEKGDWPTAQLPEATNLTNQEAKPAPAARVAEMTVSCVEETCSGRISLMPATSGAAEGQILAILETEIPRIGLASPEANVRKRYFIYPGNHSLDEVSDKDLDGLTRKPFRFSRALQTNLKFQIGKLLRPLALNIYLFDSSGNRTHHERKTIEREENAP